ncbi:hypothetical protein JT05_12200 [Desulfosporosinus sp. Tol-M]|nr:hypothetical protein JT05_12200 [Desulfosporosinus sp. Tol-M]
MRVSYEKLWHILLSKQMTKETFRKKCGLSSNTIAKLGKGQNVTTDVLVKICKTLDCDISEIMEVLPDEPTK